MLAAERYFTEWEGQPIERIFALCRKLADDPHFPAVKRWREHGGKVLGHFQVYFPEEIAHAAGMLPVKIYGARTDGQEAESRFGSYLCSIVKTSLDVALTGNIELDLFVMHPICDVARNLAGIWGRNFSYKSQILILPQNPNSRYALDYLEREYRRLAADVEACVGHRIEEDALRRSVDVYNRSRKLFAELYRIRRDTPWLIGADEAQAVMAVAGLLPRDEYNDFLETLLGIVRARPAYKQDKMRVVFEGGFCELPPIELMQTICRSCYVVDDDLFIGLRFIRGEIESTGNALRDLAEAYIEKSSYSPVQHDSRKPKEKMLLERVRGAGAEAVILGAAKMCEPGLEEQVCYSQALEAAQDGRGDFGWQAPDDESYSGIPYFITEFEENQTTFDHLSIQLETFLENVMFD